jgi:hypothetical protein
MPYHQNIVRRVMLLPVLLPLWVVLSTSQSMCSHEFFVKRNRIPVLLHVLATVHIYIVWFKFEKVLKSSNFNFRVSYWARISGQAHGEPLARPSAGALPVPPQYLLSIKVPLYRSSHLLTATAWPNFYLEKCCRELLQRLDGSTW